MKIANRHVGQNTEPFIIAEMSGNHNQSLERALTIVDAAAAAGAHALKLQTYTADTMTLNIANNEFFIQDEKSLWAGSSLYDLYQKAFTPWEWHKPIFERAKSHGMLSFSTPFDETAVDFLEELEVPCYKIASFENTDLPLIRRVAKTGKPIIISTGMATVSELEETVRAVREIGLHDFALLKCTSAYPATAADANLATIPHMRQLFNCEVGLSDHTMGVGVAVASVMLGATIIEKHFTLKRADGGVDSAFSLEPDELKQLVEGSKQAWLARGDVVYGAHGVEKKSLQYRRSLYITKDMKAGEVLTRENVKSVRPGFGLPPKYLDKILGKAVACNVAIGTPLSWKLLY